MARQLKHITSLKYPTNEEKMRSSLTHTITSIKAQLRALGMDDGVDVLFRHVFYDVQLQPLPDHPKAIDSVIIEKLQNTIPHVT